MIVRLSQSEPGRPAWVIRVPGPTWTAAHQAVSRHCLGGEQPYYEGRAAVRFGKGLRKALAAGEFAKDAAVVSELALLFEQGRPVAVEPAAGSLFDAGATGRAAEAERPPADGSMYPVGHPKHYTLQQFMMRRIPDDEPVTVGAAAKPAGPKPAKPRRKKRRVKNA